MKHSFFLATVGVSLLVTSVATAAKKNFVVDLDPSQENVAPEIEGANPKGKLNATFDTDTKRLCGKIEFSGLTGAASGVHVHRAPAGNPEGDSTPTDKVEIPPTASPVSFNIVLKDDFVTGLNADELYINIHTAKNTKGEIRSFHPWNTEGATEVPCGPETVPVGTDAGAPKDAGATSSSSSSSGSTTSSSSGASSSGATGDDDDSTGDDDDSAGSSTSGGKDAGKTTKKDEGGCNTTSAASETAPLSFALVLGVGIVALSRGRRRKR